MMLHFQNVTIFKMLQFDITNQMLHYRIIPLTDKWGLANQLSNQSHLTIKRAGQPIIPYHNGGWSTSPSFMDILWMNRNYSQTALTDQTSHYCS